ncbi:hypothetical protein ON010_g12520 [Phytophthora cinnamomi]|nr:hypothetical protein ON010_g12520 [Phytophthora cinnamomi]
MAPPKATNSKPCPRTEVSTGAAEKHTQCQLVCLLVVSSWCTKWRGKGRHSAMWKTTNRLRLEMAHFKWPCTGGMHIAAHAMCVLSNSDDTEVQLQQQQPSPQQQHQLLSNVPRKTLQSPAKLQAPMAEPMHDSADYAVANSPGKGAVNAFDEANKAAARLIKPNAILYTSALLSWLQPFQSVQCAARG